jgi:hypothetical protein
MTELLKEAIIWIWVIFVLWATQAPRKQVSSRGVVVGWVSPGDKATTGEGARPGAGARTPVARRLRPGVSEVPPKAEAKEAAQAPAAG